MRWPLYILLVCAGVATGFINTLAGSGSAVSLWALHLLGLPLDIANGTNRVAILLQTLTATREAARRGVAFVRWFLIAVVAFAASRYLGVPGWIMSLIGPAGN